MSPAGWLCLGIVVLFVVELRRQIRELGEEVSRMHKDFLAEIYIKYGEDPDGEE
jgi:hypothetical protein